MPIALFFNIRLAHSPLSVDALLFTPKGRLQFWRIMNNPAIDGAVVNRISTPLHQFFNILATEQIGKRPANTLEDHVVLKISAVEG